MHFGKLDVVANVATRPSIITVPCTSRTELSTKPINDQFSVPNAPGVLVSNVTLKRPADKPIDEIRGALKSARMPSKSETIPQPTIWKINGGILQKSGCIDKNDMLTYATPWTPNTSVRKMDKPEPVIIKMTPDTKTVTSSASLPITSTAHKLTIMKVNTPDGKQILALERTKSEEDEGYCSRSSMDSPGQNPTAMETVSREMAAEAVAATTSTQFVVPSKITIKAKEASTVTSTTAVVALPTSQGYEITKRSAGPVLTSAITQPIVSTATSSQLLQHLGDCTNVKVVSIRQAGKDNGVELVHNKMYTLMDRLGASQVKKIYRLEPPPNYGQGTPGTKYLMEYTTRKSVGANIENTYSKVPKAPCMLTKEILERSLAAQLMALPSDYDANTDTVLRNKSGSFQSAFRSFISTVNTSMSTCSQTTTQQSSHSCMIVCESSRSVPITKLPVEEADKTITVKSLAEACKKKKMEISPAEPKKVHLASLLKKPLLPAQAMTYFVIPSSSSDVVAQLQYQNGASGAPIALSSSALGQTSAFLVPVCTPTTQVWTILATVDSSPQSSRSLLIGQPNVSYQMSLLTQNIIASPASVISSKPVVCPTPTAASSSSKGKVESLDPVQKPPEKMTELHRQYSAPTCSNKKGKNLELKVRTKSVQSECLGKSNASSPAVFDSSAPASPCPGVKSDSELHISPRKRIRKHKKRRVSTAAQVVHHQSKMSLIPVDFHPLVDHDYCQFSHFPAAVQSSIIVTTESTKKLEEYKLASKNKDKTQQQPRKVAEFTSMIVPRSNTMKGKNRAKQSYPKRPNRSFIKITGSFKNDFIYYATKHNRSRTRKPLSSAPGTPSKSSNPTVLTKSSDINVFDWYKDLSNTDKSSYFGCPKAHTEVTTNKSATGMSLQDEAEVADFVMSLLPHEFSIEEPKEELLPGSEALSVDSEQWFDHSAVMYSVASSTADSKVVPATIAYEGTNIDINTMAEQVASMLRTMGEEELNALSKQVAGEMAAADAAQDQSSFIDTVYQDACQSGTIASTSFDLDDINDSDLLPGDVSINRLMQDLAGTPHGSPDTLYSHTLPGASLSQSPKQMPSSPVREPIPVPAAVAEERPPDLTVVNMFWNDLPGLTIDGQQYVRLVDIHKQMLPAKDTGILKKRCQMMNLRVVNCSERERDFLIRYANAAKSKSCLVISKEDAQILIGFYISPRTRGTCDGRDSSIEGLPDCPPEGNTEVIVDSTTPAPCDQADANLFPEEMQIRKLKIKQKEQGLSEDEKEKLRNLRQALSTKINQLQSKIAQLKPLPPLPSEVVLLPIQHRYSPRARPQYGQLLVNALERESSITIKCSTCNDRMSVRRFLKHLHVQGRPEELCEVPLLSTLQLADPHPTPDVYQAWVDFQARYEALEQAAKANKKAAKNLPVPVPSKEKETAVDVAEISSNLRQSSRSRRQKQLHPMESYVFS